MIELFEYNFNATFWYNSTVIHNSKHSIMAANYSDAKQIARLEAQEGIYEFDAEMWKEKFVGQFQIV